MLTNASGTRLKASTFPVTNELDPHVVITEPVYEVGPYPGEFPDQTVGSQRRLAYKPGDVLRQSQVAMLFETPVIGAVSPNTGAAAGGTSVVSTGEHLDGVTSVTFGGTPGTNLVILSPTQIRVDTPAHSSGSVTVTVTGDQATPTSKPNAFVYGA